MNLQSKHYQLSGTIVNTLISCRSGRDLTEPQRFSRGPVFSSFVLILTAAVLGFATEDRRAQTDACADLTDWVFRAGLQTLVRSPDRICSLEVAAITTTPIVQTKPSTDLPGSGDFRAAGVTAVEVDARTSRSEPAGCGLPFTLVLRSNAGTPNDPADDDFAYLWDDYSGLLIAPCSAEGWLKFRFEIPSKDTASLPTGWTGGHAANPMTFRPGVNWNDVITSVDRIELWWGAPPIEDPPRAWVVAVDEIEFWLDFDSPSPDRSAIVDRLTDGSMEPPLDQGPVVESSPLDDIHDRP